MPEADLIPLDIGRRLLRQGFADFQSVEAIPLLRLFDKFGGGSWLISALNPGDPLLAWGLCDAGTGSPEIGAIDLEELYLLWQRDGGRIVRDSAFDPGSLTLIQARAEARRQNEDGR